MSSTGPLWANSSSPLRSALSGSSTLSPRSSCPRHRTTGLPSRLSCNSKSSSWNGFAASHKCSDSMLKSVWFGEGDFGHELSVMWHRALATTSVIPPKDKKSENGATGPDTPRRTAGFLRLSRRRRRPPTAPVKSQLPPPGPLLLPSPRRTSLPRRRTRRNRASGSTSRPPHSARRPAVGRARGTFAAPARYALRAWERKIGDPWCTQLFFGSGLTIPTSDGTFIPPWSGDNYSSAVLVTTMTEIDSQV